MFWIFVLIAGIVVSFSMLGGLFVLVKVMTLALLAAGLIVACLLVYLFWRKVSEN